MLNFVDVNKIFTAYYNTNRKKKTTYNHTCCEDLLNHIIIGIYYTSVDYYLALFGFL